MRALFAFLAVAGIGFAPAAHAACDAVYDTGVMLDDLMMAEDAIRANDGGTALTVANKIEAGFPCMNESVPYMIVGRVFRAVGAGKSLGGDIDGARGWYLTALEVDPTFEYGLEDIAVDSPLRGTVEALREDAEIGPTELEGMDFVEGTHYLDGSLLGSPRATVGRPHVYQNEIGGTFSSNIIQGNAFPPDALAAPAVAEVVEEPRKKEKKVKEPKPAKVPKTDIDAEGVYARKRPAEKTPLIIAGGVTIGAAVGIYVAALGARGNFDDATTEEDLDKYKSSTNLLVIISGATMLVGAGVLTFGIILDDTGRPLPGININF